MKLLVAAVYTNYSTSVASDVGIEHIDAYVAAPQGDQIMLKFQRVFPESPTEKESRQFASQGVGFPAKTATSGDEKSNIWVDEDLVKTSDRSWTSGLG